MSILNKYSQTVERSLQKAVQYAFAYQNIKKLQFTDSYKPPEKSIKTMPQTFSSFPPPDNHRKCIQNHVAFESDKIQTKCKHLQEQLTGSHKEKLDCRLTEDK